MNRTDFTEQRYVTYYEGLSLVVELYDIDGCIIAYSNMLWNEDTFYSCE